MIQSKKMVPLRMHPETIQTKKPSPEQPDDDANFNFLVMGHRKPEEWKTGAQDAPLKARG